MGEPERPKEKIIENRPTTSQERLLAEWVAYWIDALKYAESVGGVSYQKMKDFFAGDNPTWNHCFIIPLIWSGYLNPVRHGKETTVAPGWSIEKIRWRLESGIGLPTPPPFSPPNRFEQQTTAETVNNRPESRETGETA